MKSPKGNAAIIVVLLVFAALVVAGWYWNKNVRQQIAVAPIPNEEQHPASSPCGLTIDSPLPASNTSLPLVVSGTIDTGSNLDCRWTLFEGQAGTIEIRNATTNAIVLNKVPVMLTQIDWMDRAINQQPVDFSVTVSALDVAYVGPALIIFEEDNPSGEGIPDVVMMNITIQ